jgi:hypothetical protein
MQPFELLIRDVLILLTYLFTCTATKLTLVINESTGEEVASCKLTKNAFGKQVFVKFSLVSVVDTYNVKLFRGHQYY